MRISLLLAFSLSSFTFAAESAAPKKPNILIIVADDLGYADTGFNGSKTAITPKLDSFVKSGIKLTDFRACPMCSPTRAGSDRRTGGATPSCDERGKAARQGGTARKAGRRKIRQERRGITPWDRAERRRGRAISGSRSEKQMFSTSSIRKVSC
tara:strand:+ start:1338 stop:1799 length:462 start_codon:yes stop_codon:yes gene_type:complete